MRLLQRHPTVHGSVSPGRLIHHQPIHLDVPERLVSHDRFHIQIKPTSFCQVLRETVDPALAPWARRSSLRPCSLTTYPRPGLQYPGDLTQRPFQPVDAAQVPRFDDAIERIVLEREFLAAEYSLVLDDSVLGDAPPGKLVHPAAGIDRCDRADALQVVGKFKPVPNPRRPRPSTFAE
jgi:hypothetical protein